MEKKTEKRKHGKIFMNDYLTIHWQTDLFIYNLYINDYTMGRVEYHCVIEKMKTKKNRLTIFICS